MRNQQLNKGVNVAKLTLVHSVPVTQPSFPANVRLVLIPGAKAASSNPPRTPNPPAIALRRAA